MPAARRTDPTTSHTAATINPSDLDELRAAIVRKFNTRPVTGYTDEELVEVVQQKITRAPQRIRTARSDLAKLGLLKLSDATRRGESGYKARVWQRA